MGGCCGNDNNSDLEDEVVEDKVEGLL